MTKRRRQEQRDRAIKIVRTLRQAGYEAYLAGGCVRDVLLGLEPKDYDIATEARPEKVRKLFRRSQYVGEAFGVVLVYIGGRFAPGIEVATFRTEWGYEDGRRPTGVNFTDAEHDAQRRDFTANGLFADPLDEKLEPVEPGQERVIDFVGGRADLENQILRAIGDPNERFREDYLRMLRAARFASRLGFTIDPATESAIRESAPKLTKISRERIGQELMLMLTSNQPVQAAGLIQRLELDAPTLEEPHIDAELHALGGLFQTRFNDLPVSASANNQTTQSCIDHSYSLVLSAWMLDRGSASATLADAAKYVEQHGKEKAGQWRKALCLSNNVRDLLSQILDVLPEASIWSTLSVAKRKRLLSRPAWADAWKLIQVLGPEQVVRQIEQDSKPLWEEGVCPNPFVSGDDLIGMGFPAGPKIGDMLDAVYDAQLEKRVRDRDEALNWIKQTYEL